jgi:hypothetical protein
VLYGIQFSLIKKNLSILGIGLGVASSFTYMWLHRRTANLQLQIVQIREEYGVGKACVTNPPIPSPARLRCTCSVFLGNFGEWPHGATSAAVLQQSPFSRRRGAVQGTGKF